MPSISKRHSSTMKRTIRCGLLGAAACGALLLGMGFSNPVSAEGPETGKQ